MSVLERGRNVTVLRPAGRINLRLAGLALFYGAIGAVALALVVLVPTLTAWTADSRSSVSWLQAMSFAGDGWVLAHHGRLLATAGGATHTITFSPLFFTALAVWFTRTAAKAVLREVTEAGRDAGRGWHSALFFVGGYLIAGVLLTLLGSTGPASPQLLSVLPGALIVATVGFGWAVRAEPESAAFEVCAGLWERLPVAVRRAVRPAAQSAVALVAVAAVLLVVLVALSWSRIGEVNGLLGAGMIGTTVLGLAQLASLPNFALLVTGWASGASVHLGTATVSAGAVQNGLVPSVPVLGAIPDPGAFPVWVRLAPLLIVLAGGLAGFRAAGSLSALSSLTTKLATAAAAAGLLTLAVSLLIWIAGAHVSDAPLAHAQLSWTVVPLLAVEFFGGAMAAAAAMHFLKVRRSHV